MVARKLPVPREARKLPMVSRACGRGFHDVVAGGAVNVHVEKCGGQGCAGEVEHLRAFRQFSGFAGGDGADPSVFDDDDRVVGQPAAVPEPLCSEHGLHIVDYCRRSGCTRGEPADPVK